MFIINILKICKNFASIFSFKGYNNSVDFLSIFLNRRVNLKIPFEATCPFDLLTAFYEHCKISVITNILFLRKLVQSKNQGDRARYLSTCLILRMWVIPLTCLFVVEVGPIDIWEHHLFNAFVTRGNCRSFGHYHSSFLQIHSIMKEPLPSSKETFRHCNAQPYPDMHTENIDQKNAAKQATCRDGEDVCEPL